MKEILKGRLLVELESVDSTQKALRILVEEGSSDVGGVLALEQTAGVGRRGRTWHTPKGSSLALSLALYDYADWPAPQLLGMAVAIAAAQALDCDVAWPNDLVITPPFTGGSVFSGGDGASLSQSYKKVGGVLGEVARTLGGKSVPVIGIGVNLTTLEFPSEIAESATSLALAGRESMTPQQACAIILERLVHIPEPTSWQRLEPLWELCDRTPGKRYRVPDGRIAIAVRVGNSGQLIADAEGELLEVPSAEAIF